MPPQVLAALATLVGFAPHGNRLDLRLDHGSAELVWVSPSAFHFRRVLDGPLAALEHPAREAVAFDVEETPAAGGGPLTAAAVSRSPLPRTQCTSPLSACRRSRPPCTSPTA